MACRSRITDLRGMRPKAPLSSLIRRNCVRAARSRKRLSAHGDPLEELSRLIDFEGFRPTLVAALGYGDGAKGGRPPFDPVAMLKVLILAAQNNVSDARMEYLIRIG